MRRAVPGSATRWWRSGPEARAAASGLASTGGGCTTATPSSSPGEPSSGKRRGLGPRRAIGAPPSAPQTRSPAFPGLCSGFCTSSSCSSLMLIQRPGGAASSRAAQAATSSASNPTSACTSTLIGVLKELPRTSPSSTPVCRRFECVHRRLCLRVCVEESSGASRSSFHLLHARPRFARAAVRVASECGPRCV